MTPFPICLLFYTSTKGHYGRKDLYLDTLRLIDAQIPLLLFATRLAHIKVTPGEEVIGEQMKIELERRGFQVHVTVANWSRGTEHQLGYLIDMRKMSQDLALLTQPYMLLVEDDSPFRAHKVDSLAALSAMVEALETNPDLVSTRFIRRDDWHTGVPILKDGGDYFFSPNFDFQPAVLRSRDYMIANLFIERHWEQVKHLQCELLMRIALDTLTRSSLRHLVWKPDYGETYHLGVPNPHEILKTLSI